MDAAYVTFQETIKDSLELSEFAKIAVLSQNLLAINPNEIKNVSADLTMVGRKIEYRANCRFAHSLIYIFIPR